MTVFLVDTSVLIAWFRPERGPDEGAAVALRDRHASGDIDGRIIDLAVYEFGSVLARSHRLDAEAVAEQVEDLLVVCGPPLALGEESRREAARLAATFGLTYYDAAWAAAARVLGAPLVSSDRELVAAGLALTPADARTAFDR